MKAIKHIIPAVVCLLVLSVQALATVAWTNPGGSADYYSWANGQNENGLFGDPTLNGQSLTFVPQGFRAESLNGAAGTASDTFTFDIIAASGYTINAVGISEYGDYGILGIGGVDVNAVLTVENLSAAGLLTAQLITTPTMPAGSGMGSWQAAGSIEIDNWTHIRVTLSNTIEAETDSSSVAFIEKKIIGCPVSVTAIPEPATLALLAGGVFYLRKQRSLR